MKLLLFALGAFFLLTLVSGAYVFVVGCVRRKDLPWLVEQEIKKTSYGKYYDFIVRSDKWLKDHCAQDVYINSHDGLNLHGLWIPVTNPRGTVLFAHGYRSTMLVDFGLAFDFYHKHGMNLLIPEQRAHGRSEGRYITFGVKESLDMQCWVDYHNQQLSTVPVILSGLSMGASTMLFLADKDLPENVKGIIADCGFTSPKEILSSVFKRVIHLPETPTLWVTDILARLFAGFHLNEQDTRRSLSKSRLPVFMVHGTNDGFVPCEMTESGYAACVGDKQILLVDGADHGVSFLVAKEKYTAMITDFLDKCIGEEITNGLHQCQET